MGLWWASILGKGNQGIRVEFDEYNNSYLGKRYLLILGPIYGKMGGLSDDTHRKNYSKPKSLREAI